MQSLTLLVVLAAFFIRANGQADLEIEKAASELMNNMLQKQDMNIEEKCQQVYTFCKEVGLIVGKPKGTEGEYCLLQHECSNIWKEGNLIALKGKIVSGYSRMIVGLSPEMVEEIKLKIRRCC